MSWLVGHLTNLCKLAPYLKILLKGNLALRQYNLPSLLWEASTKPKAENEIPSPQCYNTSLPKGCSPVHSGPHIPTFL